MYFFKQQNNSVILSPMAVNNDFQGFNYPVFHFMRSLVCKRDSEDMPEIFRMLQTNFKIFVYQGGCFS